MSIFTPTIQLWETLVPELLVPELKSLPSRLPKLSQESITDREIKQQESFLTLLNAGTIRWTIIRSLYDDSSDYLFTPSEEWFKCSEWQKYLKEKLPTLTTINTEDLIFDESTDWVKDNFTLSLEKRYHLTPAQIQKFLLRTPFEVSDKTIRNHFQTLANGKNSLEPLINKQIKSKGNYKKISFQQLESLLIKKQIKTENTIEDTFSMDFIPEQISNIVELLLSKIQGKQRMFIHHNYILSQEHRERADDRADQLKEIWKKKPIPPISIIYDSASLNQKAQYIVYPVCLYYYQRAYYLCAFGQAPGTSNKEKNQWYNYRLERIEKIQELSWENPHLPFSETEILGQTERYNPEYIQQQLEKAYGFDFYQPKEVMLLRFEPNFEERYIKNSFRHDTFEKLQDLEEVISMIQQEQISQIDQIKLINSIKQYPNYAYYSLSYRQNDNNVIMRLRAWSPNVEVLLPWDLRQRMKEDLQKIWYFYQDN